MRLARLWLIAALLAICPASLYAAAEQYRSLAQRFNRDLAGRFPFAGPAAQDADPQQVSQFFRDYPGRRAKLDRLLENPRVPRREELRQFLVQLDDVAEFFAPTLARPTAAAIRLDVRFRARPQASPGSEQIVSWELYSGVSSARYPNGGSVLDWYGGDNLTLKLDWARPTPRLGKLRPCATPRTFPTARPGWIERRPAASVAHRWPVSAMPSNARSRRHSGFGEPSGRNAGNSRHTEGRCA